LLLFRSFQAGSGRVGSVAINCADALLISAPSLPERIEDVWAGYNQAITEVHLTLPSNLIESIPSNYFANFQANSDGVDYSGVGGTAPFTVFRISHNRIIEIPNALAAPDLYQMDLSDNEITLLEPGLTSHFPALKELNLEDNKITALLDGVFVPATGGRLSGLNRFQFNNNPLQAVSPAALRALGYGSPARLVTREFRVALCGLISAW
jgi:hypothetical protein